MRSIVLVDHNAGAALAAILVVLIAPADGVVPADAVVLVVRAEREAGAGVLDRTIDAERVDEVSARLCAVFGEDSSVERKLTGRIEAAAQLSRQVRRRFIAEVEVFVAIGRHVEANGMDAPVGRTRHIDTDAGDNIGFRVVGSRIDVVVCGQPGFEHRAHDERAKTDRLRIELRLDAVADCFVFVPAVVVVSLGHGDRSHQGAGRSTHQAQAFQIGHFTIPQFLCEADMAWVVFINPCKFNTIPKPRKIQRIGRISGFTRK